MSGSWLWIGVLLGLRHALEPDHVAAVATLNVRSRSLEASAAVASAWGLGHALVLLAVALGVNASGLRVPPGLAPWLEGAGGVLLVVLGIDVLRRLRAIDRPMETATVPEAEHRLGPVPRALLVGSLHGLAGSAMMVVVTLPVLASRGQIVPFLLLFGLGSTLGMIACSLALTLPVRFLAGERVAVLRLMLGGGSVAVGTWAVVRASMSP